ncbi:MAG: metallophosphoesterase [Acidobacteria bacterium]|nr:MAG: metallophosphoesterase [Acidobacteriota bacterium]
MRVLIYSDVHANLEALLAVEEAAAGRYDVSLCLGDIVGYGANPNETAAWVHTHTPTVIRGNHDRACASLKGIAGFNAVAAQAALWTHQNLRPEHLTWLDHLPAGPLPWDHARLVHGSPLDEDEYLLEPVQAAGAFAADGTSLCWYGHSHVQGGFVLADDQVAVLPSAAEEKPGASARASSRELVLRPDGRYLLNPGSVGQPRDGDWRAAFALYNTETRRVVFHRVPYDITQAQTKIVAAGLPVRLAQRLAAGR